MRPLPVIAIVLANLWLCMGGPGSSASALDGTPVEAHVDRPLTWDCGGSRDRLEIGRDGRFVWEVSTGEDSWTHVEGTWTAAGTSGIGATLAIEGTRSTRAEAESEAIDEPFAGTVHVAPLRALPRAGVLRELDRWRQPCVRNLEPEPLFEAAIGVDALALRGDLEGLFHP